LPPPAKVQQVVTSRLHERIHVEFSFPQGDRGDGHMVWYGTLLGRRDKICSTAIKGKKKIAREDALTLFYQLFYQEEGILLF